MDEKILRLAQALIGARPTPAGSIPGMQLPPFQQPGAAFNKTMPPLGANGPLPPFQQPGQAMAQALPFTNAPRQMPAAAPPGLLPLMQPAPQAAQPQPAYDGVRANWGPQEQEALQAILEEQKRQMAAQNQLPNQWVNPWQAP